MLALRPLWLATLVAACSAPVALADPPAPPRPVAYDAPPVASPAPPPAPPACDTPAPPEYAFIGVQLLAGQQCGIRGQYAVAPQPGGTWLLEGFYGATLTRIASSEAVGGGVRRSWRRQCVGDGRAVDFSAGIDAFYQCEHGGSVMVAPSAEVSYLRLLNDQGCAWEVGLIGGVGFGVSGTGDGGRDAAGQVTPLISVFAGLRF